MIRNDYMQVRNNMQRGRGKPRAFDSAVPSIGQRCTVAPQPGITVESLLVPTMSGRLRSRMPSDSRRQTCARPTPLDPPNDIAGLYREPESLDLRGYHGLRGSASAPDGSSSARGLSLIVPSEYRARYRSGGAADPLCLNDVTCHIRPVHEVSGKRRPRGARCT